MIFYNYNQVKLLVVLVISTYFILFFPLLVSAKIIINEIMYDPEGTDTGREWIEVFNSGESDIDLTAYKLLESNVNHKITNYNETPTAILKAGQFAIIADNSEKFLIDFPGFAGLLFDSAFSLNNTGEVLVMIDPIGNIDNNFEYSADLGAGNNSNSLQRADNGFWIEAKPTVGAANKQESETPTNDSGSDSNTSNSTSTDSGTSSGSVSTHSGQNTLTKYVEKSQLEIGLGRDRTVSVNTPIEFKAVYNTDKKPRFLWNFGDGAVDKGEKTENTYKHTGNYNVVLNAFLNGYQATSRIKVKVITISVENLSITSGKNVDIVLKNKTNLEVNLGGFTIKYGQKYFDIPPDTIIDANSEIIIPFENTGFELDIENNFSEIFYPNGKSLFKESILIPTTTAVQML
jgi:hypothetical protein